MTPLYPSTEIQSPFLIILKILSSTLSINGIPDIIAPIATMGSASIHMNALGACLFLASLYIMYEPTVDPLPPRNIKTLSVIDTPSNI